MNLPDYRQRWIVGFERISGRPTRVLAAFLAMGLTVSHWFALRDPAVITGPLLLLDNLFTVVLAAAFTLLAAALGLRVMRYLGTATPSPADTLTFSMAIGTGTLATAILAVGELGQLNSLALALLLAIGIWVTKEDLAQLPDLGLQAIHEVSALAGRPGVVLLLVVTAAMLLQAVAPPTDYDSLMYHLQGPAEFLGRGGIYLPDGNFHVAYVGLAHMLYLPALAFGAPSTPAVLSTFFALGLGIVVLRVGVRFFSQETGRLALILLWGSPIVMIVAVTPKIDVSLAFFLLLAHYALLNGFQRPQEAKPWVLLAGLLVGFGFGVKYLALVYLAALAPLILVVMYKASSVGIQRLRLGLLFAIALIGTSLPWLLKNWLLFGAPLFPRFSEPLTPAWLAAMGGSSHALPSPGTVDMRPLLTVREPFNLLDWFMHPERLTPESDGFSYGANTAFLFLLAAIPLLRRRVFSAILLPGVVYIGAVLLLNGNKLNLRYLIPAIPVLTLASAFAFTAVLHRVRNPSLRVATILMVVAVALLPSGLTLAGKLVGTRAPVLAFGGLSRHDYQETTDPERFTYSRMVRIVNGSVSADSKVLMLFEGRGYGFSAEVLQDNVLTNWPLLSQTLSPSRCLEGSGITHVLVGTGILGYFVGRGLNPEDIHWNMFPDFEARCLVPVERRPGFSLFEVAPR